MMIGCSRVCVTWASFKPCYKSAYYPSDMEKKKKKNLRETSSDLMSSLGAAPSHLGSCPVNSSCLALPRLLALCPQHSLSGSARVPLPMPDPGTSDQQMGSITGLTSLISHFSRITVLHCLMSRVLKTGFIYFYLPILFVFRQEGKSRPSYSILTEVVCVYTLNLCWGLSFGVQKHKRPQPNSLISLQV